MNVTLISAFCSFADVNKFEDKKKRERNDNEDQKNDEEEAGSDDENNGGGIDAETEPAGMEV